MNNKMWQMYRRDGDHLVAVAVARAANKDDALSKANLLDGEIDAELMVEVPWGCWDKDWNKVTWSSEWIREGVIREWPVSYRSHDGILSLFATDGMRYSIDDLRRGDGFFRGGESAVVILIPISEYRRVLDYLGDRPMDVMG